MKKHIFLLLMFLMLPCGLALSQVLSVSNGISFSRLTSPVGNNYDNDIISYSGMLAVEYLDRKYYGMSSEIGYIRKGGSMDMTFTTDPFSSPVKNPYNKMDYLHINTTFRGKLPLGKGLGLFLGIGPKLDILLHRASNDFKL